MLQELMIDLLDCLMAMGFRERAREEGEARMKYKRRGRWEGYSVWLALGNGPIMAGTHCPAYERGYGVRASVTSQPAPSYPLVPLSSPESLVRPHSYLRLPASQCVGTGRASTLSRSLCRSMPPTLHAAGPRGYLHCSLNWVSSAVRRGNAHRSQVTSASPCLCLYLLLYLCVTKENMGSSPAVPVGGCCSSSSPARASSLPRCGLHSSSGLPVDIHRQSAHRVT